MNDETNDIQAKESATAQKPRRPLLRLVSSRELEPARLTMKARLLLARRSRPDHDDDPDPSAA